MAYDRFATIPKEHAAEFEKQAETLIRNFFGACGGTLEWKDGRWYITLPGAPSDAMRDTQYPNYGVRDDVRWIEVWFGVNGEPEPGVEEPEEPGGVTIDVMTRSTDQFTNALASKLFDCFVHAFDGKRWPE